MRLSKICYWVFLFEKSHLAQFFLVWYSGNLIFVHSKSQSIQNPHFLLFSIGHSRAFYVVFVPLEYVPTIPPHSTYVKVSCFILFKSYKGVQCLHRPHCKCKFVVTLTVLFKSTKQITMTNVEWGGILGIYSSGTKTT